MHPDALAARLQTVRIIWIALTLSAVVYTGFGIGLPLYILPKPLLTEPVADAFRLVAVIGSLAIAGITIWWRRRSLHRPPTDALHEALRHHRVVAR